MEESLPSNFLNSRSMKGLNGEKGRSNNNTKNTSIFTQSATSYTRPNIVWSFPKAQRFKEIKLETKDVPLIDLGSTLSKSSTSLGIGKRHKFKPVDTPASSITHRDFKTVVGKVSQTNNNSLPYSRESWDPHKEIPGPGSYLINREFEDKNKGVLIKSRNKVLDPVKENPGPGYYRPAISNVQASRYSGIAFGSSQRYDFTKLVQAKNPGPGSYEMISAFEKKSNELRLQNELRSERERVENILRSEMD